MVRCKTSDENPLPRNDIASTEMTFGFQTAVQICTFSIDRLHTTAESHDRVLMVEVMGRHAGWIALHAGLSGGANGILIPEVPFDLDEVAGWVESRFRTNYSPIIVVSGESDLGVTVELLDAGADPVADQGGSTPADFATLAGKTEILALLQSRRDNAAKPTRWFSKLIGWVRK